MTEFNPSDSFKQERVINRFISTKYPFLKWTDGKEHDCYCEEIPIELKNELGYVITGAEIKYIALHEHMKQKFNLKMTPSPNVFFEIFSNLESGRLGGVFQSYFKDVNKPFLYVHVYPYNDVFRVMSGSRAFQFLLREVINNKNANYKKIPNRDKESGRSYVSVGLPVNFNYLKTKMEEGYIEDISFGEAESVVKEKLRKIYQSTSTKKYQESKIQSFLINRFK